MTHNSYQKINNILNKIKPKYMFESLEQLLDRRFYIYMHTHIISTSLYVNKTQATPQFRRTVAY